jgi:hypothetical protein
MRLIKLAMLALFGYAVYEFLRGMLQDTQLGNRMGEAFHRAAGEARERTERAMAGGAGGGGQVISGPGEGADEATLERDGGSVRHKVGRGVVS